ncbi:hypothetical protein NDU88_002672, partial [Pleurodeles waltl]
SDDRSLSCKYQVCRKGTCGKGPAVFHLKEEWPKMRETSYLSLKACHLMTKATPIK